MTERKMVCACTHPERFPNRPDDAGPCVLHGFMFEKLRIEIEEGREPGLIPMQFVVTLLDGDEVRVPLSKPIKEEQLDFYKEMGNALLEVYRDRDGEDMEFSDSVSIPKAIISSVALEPADSTN